MGGRSREYVDELRQAKLIVIEEMEGQARAPGANAAAGIDLDYETIDIGSGGNMLMASVSGTAVLHEE